MKKTLIFILMMGAGLTNIAYGWGVLMLFATSKYFARNNRLDEQIINIKTSKLI